MKLTSTIKRAIGTLAVLALAGFNQNAHAELVRWTIEGTYVDGPLVGQQFSGWVDFETTNPNYVPGSTSSPTYANGGVAGFFFTSPFPDPNPTIDFTQDTWSSPEETPLRDFDWTFVPTFTGHAPTHFDSLDGELFLAFGVGTGFGMKLYYDQANGMTQTWQNGELDVLVADSHIYDLAWQPVTNPVPEPGSLLLFFSACSLLFVSPRKRKVVDRTV